MEMASAVVPFLLTNVKEFISDKINQLRGGEEVVRWIEYELETLIPQLERAESLFNRHLGSLVHQEYLAQYSELNERLTNMIRKAEVLAETYTKMVIQSNAAPNLINSIQIPIISKRLHKIRDDISQARDQLSELDKTTRRVHLSRLPDGNGDATSPDGQTALTSQLRRCVHYFLLFPPDFRVPTRRLIALWVAEGLVRPKKHDTQSVEEIAQAYLDELSRLGMIRVELNRSGKVKTCSIDAAHWRGRDQLLEEAKKANFLQDRDGNIRRLVDCNGTNHGYSFIQIQGNPSASRLVRDYRDVISFFSFNTQEGSKPGEDIGDFLRTCISNDCFIWLNVLDLERVFRPKLPDTLGEIVSLKYLGLRWTYLEQLPHTVNRLLNLQVLDVKHTYISVLPRSIWSMEYLRHLYLSEAYRTRFPAPPYKVTLTALQTLWGGYVDEETCVVRGLDRLLNIRKLGLSCRSRESKRVEMSDKLKAIDKWISNLKHLESLRLKSRDENGEPVDLHLTSLEGNKNLSTVYLIGKLDRSILCELPVSLTDVTLSGSELGLDPMGFLGRLPNLMILRLLGQSVVCSKMYCSKRGFRQLKVLWIWKLDDLMELEADEQGSLPALEELEIRSCHKMEKLPDRLGQIETLEVRLTSMKQEFLQTAMAKYARVEHFQKDDQYILTNKPTRKTGDLVSPSVTKSYQHSISRKNSRVSIF